MQRNRWSVEEFNSNKKEQRVDIAQAVKLNRQSGERVFNPSAPQSDDDALYQSQNYHTQGEEMLKVQRANVPVINNIPKGVQFLSPRHVTTADGFEAEVFKVTTPENGGKLDSYGNPYVAYFKHGFDKYSKGLKPTSELLFQLVDILGADETKWIGKKVIVNKTTDDEGGERLVFLPVAKAAAKGR